MTNMTYMKEDVADWLVDNNIWVCTSLDGTEEVHNFNRTWTKSQNAYQSVLKWIKHFNNLYIERGYDPDLYHVDALMTTTKKTLEHWKEIVHLYLDLGIRNIHLRPLNPYGFVFGTWKMIGYSIEEYLDFYAQALDYIIELNRNGQEMIEGTASIFLKKLLTPDDPNFVDMLSPCGAGTGQVAYNYDGTMFTCDEGRMTDAMGNNLFAIGSVGETSYVDMIRHPTVKAMAVASLQDSLPSCNTCWNKPFCGVCPMHNYMSGGDIFGQRPRSPKCTEYYTISSLCWTSSTTTRRETWRRFSDDGLPLDPESSPQTAHASWNVSQRLYLTVTRECDLRCTYCPTVKDDWPPLSIDDAIRSVDLFCDQFGGGDIKLFWRRTSLGSRRSASRHGALSNEIKSRGFIFPQTAWV